MADAALAKRLQDAAEVIADRARELSSWSEMIPRTIHTETMHGVDGVKVVAGGVMAPYAITFEAPDAKNWRHPVFATGPRDTWDWVAQEPRRFLKPAAEEELGDAAKVLSGVVDDWLIPRGFRFTY